MALDFKAKLGPLPVWGWGIVGVVVVLLGYQFFSRTGSGSGTSGSSALDGSGYQTAGIQGGSASGVDPLPETNQGWLARVSRLVAGANSASPSAVYAALYKYVTGQDYSQQEKAYIDQAISMGGAPPEGTQGIGTPEAVTPPKITIAGIFKSVFNRGVYSQDASGTKTPLSLAEWAKTGYKAPILTSNDGDTIVKYERTPSGTIYAIDSSGDRGALSFENWVDAGRPGYVQL